MARFSELLNELVGLIAQLIDPPDLDNFFLFF